jgi:hypothetical protein
LSIAEVADLADRSGFDGHALSPWRAADTEKSNTMRGGLSE